MINVAATCATIAGILANPAAPSNIILTGDCPSIDITRTYSPAIKIDASKATVRGLRIVGGGGVIWIGGILRSQDGEGTGGPAGYGALVRSANDVIIDGVRFIDSKKALVVDKTNNFIVRNSRFEIGEDAVIASAGSNLEFSKNTVVGVSMRQTECLQAEKIAYGLPRRVCEAQGGVWTDGWHQDAFQFRDGIKGLKITGNVVRNAQQGIGQMDAKNDAPVSDVLIDGNDVEVTGFHSITMNVASNVRITNNRVRQMTGRRTIIRPGVGAVVCGNDVQRPADPGSERCK